MHNSLLLQRYSVLGRASAAASDAPAKAPISHLLYRGTQALLALERLIAARNEALGSACALLSRNDMDPQERASFSFWSSDIIDCNDAVCSLLNAIVLIQNCTPRALNYFTDIGDVHKSFHDVMNDLAQSKPRLKWPERIVTLFSDYWSSTGNVVRYLRDADQHYYPDLTDCRVLPDAGPRLILNYLDSDKKTIDILEYAPRAMFTTFEFVENCFQAVTDLKPRYYGFTPNYDKEIDLSLGDGLAVLYFMDKNPERWTAVNIAGNNLEIQRHGVGLQSPLE